MKGKVLYLLLFMLNAYAVYAESKDIYLDMSLDELINTDIVVTASKKAEDLFETPLSVTIIKKEDILRSAATSIPEALRLAPGLIVREETPGNYDVHIRGFDTVTTNLVTPNPSCSIILVMVDNRVVYDYFAGGTFWESLGIDIADIERIEVVRGPASALYGPNAMQGVINIITSHAKETGLHCFTSTNTNFHNNGSTQFTIDYKHKDQWQTSLSGNMMYAGRMNEQYYSWRQNKYVDLEHMDTLMFLFDQMNALDYLDVKYKRPKRGLEKYSLNFFSRYNISPDDYISVDCGSHNAETQKTTLDNFTTALSEFTSRGQFFNLKAVYKKLEFQQTINHGKYLNNYDWNQYDYLNYDFTLEYPIEISKLTLRPGVSYRAICYGSSLFWDISSTPLQTSSKKREKMTSNSFSILADFPFNDRLRVISGVRSDQFSINHNTALTYESAVTYRLNKEHLFRLVFSDASRNPFMLDTYIGESSTVFLQDPAGPHNNIMGLTFIGSKDLDYLRNQSMEIGWRMKNESFTLDAETFYSKLSEFPDLVPDGGHNTIGHMVIGDSVYTYMLSNFNFITKKDKKVNQKGITLALSYQFSPALQLALNTSWQETEEKATAHDSLQYVSFSPKSTPTLYGGAYCTYAYNDRLHFNVSDYYCSKQVYETLGFDAIRVTIKPFHDVCLKTTYNITPNQELYLSLKNLLGTHREYAFVDQVPFSWLFGYSCKL